MPLCLQCQYQPHFPALTALEKNHLGPCALPFLARGCCSLLTYNIAFQCPLSFCFVILFLLFRVVFVGFAVCLTRPNQIRTVLCGSAEQAALREISQCTLQLSTSNSCQRLLRLATVLVKLRKYYWTAGCQLSHVEFEEMSMCVQVMIPYELHLYILACRALTQISSGAQSHSCGKGIHFSNFARVPKANL